MGLETLDNFIRNSIIGKSLRLEIFERAVHALGDVGISTYAYILLKPPGLTEQEAVEECVKTIGYFFNLARQANVPHFRTTLKPLFITKGTILEQLYREGLASPPTLWSLLEVLKRVHHLGTIFSPRTDESLSDDRTAKNCPECTPRVQNSINEFNRTGDVRSLDVESCGCRENRTEVKM
jgi:radical SAM enzyme (TIGR01210 family)